MNGALVAVVAILIAASRREMNGAGYLFVEQNIAYGLSDKRIDAQSEFSYIPSAFVDIEDFIQLFGLVCLGLDNLAVA